MEGSAREGLLVDGAGAPLAEEDSGSVELLDGTSVDYHAIAPENGSALQRFHHRLSERSIYLRFFAAKPQLSDMETGYFTNVDGMNRGRFLVLRHRFLHSSWCYQNRGSLSLIAITGGLLYDPS